MHGEDIVLRQAKNEDGEAIAALQGMDAELFGWIDWNDIEPSWVVAEDASGGIVGALQVCPGKPISRIEMLVVSNRLGKMSRGVVAKRLVDYGIQLSRMYGAQAVSGMIEDENVSFQQIASERGYGKSLPGSLFIKRIV